MDANSTTSLSCQNGMSLQEDEIYVEIAWWLEGIVHLVISILGLFANSISMSVMLSKGEFQFYHQLINEKISLYYAQD